MPTFEDYIIKSVSREEYRELKSRYGRIIDAAMDEECQNIPMTLKWRYNPNAEAIGIHVRTIDKKEHLAGTEKITEEELGLVKLLKSVIGMRLGEVRMINGPWTE